MDVLMDTRFTTGVARWGTLVANRATSEAITVSGRRRQHYPQMLLYGVAVGPTWECTTVYQSLKGTGRPDSYGQMGKSPLTQQSNRA